MTAKEYLEQGIYINDAIEENILELERLDSELCRCTQAYPDMPSQIQNIAENNREKKIAEHMDKSGELIEDIRLETEQLSEIRRDIRKRIYAIDNPKHRLLLSKRYIRFLKWDKIQDEFGYLEPKSVFRLHRAAVNEFIKVHGNEL